MFVVRLLLFLLFLISAASAHPANYCWTWPRDALGHIRRSSSARAAFKRQHPCPATGLSTGACRGYVIDHVVPLERGGRDRPENMQWQTRAAAAAKDRTE